MSLPSAKRLRQLNSEDAVGQIGHGLLRFAGHPFDAAIHDQRGRDPGHFLQIHLQQNVQVSLPFPAFRVLTA